MRVLCVCENSMPDTNLQLNKIGSLYDWQNIAHTQGRLYNAFKYVKAIVTTHQLAVQCHEHSNIISCMSKTLLLLSAQEVAWLLIMLLGLGDDSSGH